MATNIPNFDSVSKIKYDSVRLREHFATLTKSQSNFAEIVLKWLYEPRKTLVIVSGGPGTGKTYLVKNTFDHIKAVQVRMSYTARSASALGGRTIHSTLRLDPSHVEKLDCELRDETDLYESIMKSKEIVTHFDCSVDPLVVIVDEVSMITGWFMYWIMRFFMTRSKLPVLFVCMGDPHQLNPIKSTYNLFSFKISDIGGKRVHLTESKRYTPEYENVVNCLRHYVDTCDDTGMFAFICGHFPVTEKIDDRMLMEADKAMAFKNSTVKKYNNFYIKNKIAGPEIKLDGVVFKKGCAVLVTKNSYSAAKNGTELIFLSVGDHFVTCKDPKTDSECKIPLDPWTGCYNLDVGFAATVHKYQGETIDKAKIVVNFDENRDLNLVYTALSRVRDMEQIIAIKL